MGIFIGYLLGILTAIKPKNQNRSSDHASSDSQTRQRFVDGPISVVCIPPSTTPEKEAENKKRKNRETIKYRVEIAGAFILLVYAFFTVLIWISNRNANDIAEKSYQFGQRAYVTYHGVKTVTHVVTNPRGKESVAIDITYQWENAGNTPAIGVQAFIAAHPQDDEPSEEEFVGVALANPIASAHRPDRMASIGPKITVDSVTLHAPEDFATDHPEVPRLFWGWILYRDIFPGTKVHLTEFCLKANDISRDDDLQYQFHGATCDHHNCIDDFCLDYSSIIGLAPPRS